VHFRRSDVIVTGDIFTTTQYPFIDLKNGGSLQGTPSEGWPTDTCLQGGSHLSRGRAHSILNILMRDDGCPHTHVKIVAREIRARQARIGAGCVKSYISPRMIRTEAGVEDELDGLVADEVTNRRNHLFGQLTCARVRHQGALFTSLHRNIAGM